MVDILINIYIKFIWITYLWQNHLFRQGDFYQPPKSGLKKKGTLIPSFGVFQISYGSFRTNVMICQLFLSFILEENNGYNSQEDMTLLSTLSLIILMRIKLELFLRNILFPTSPILNSHVILSIKMDSSGKLKIGF